MITEKLKLVQKKELDLLSSFDQICQDNQLTYYALGGTLLGAIRHGGFIPWDDDMDLGMPRQDYEKFIKIGKKYLPEFMKIEVREDNLNSLSIIDTATSVKFGDVNCQPFIDIFPLDGYPSKYLSRLIHSKKILFYRMLSKVSVIDQLLDRDRGTLENLIFKTATVLKLNKVLNTYKINNHLQNIIKKYDFNTSQYVGNILGAYREREIVSKDIIGKPIKLKFDNVTIYAPEKSNDYLTHVYGDFMVLPPEDKRRGHFETAYGE